MVNIKVTTILMRNHFYNPNTTKTISNTSIWLPLVQTIIYPRLATLLDGRDGRVGSELMLRFSLIKNNFHSGVISLIKKNKLPPRPKLTDAIELEFEEKFLHGGRGPGGQKINKCNSKVQLKHLPSGIVVECQETRSRSQNRKIAREKMALKIAIRENGGKPTDREIALQAWEKQNKRSRERKSKEKHLMHKELKKTLELEKIKEEEELLGQLMK